MLYGEPRLTKDIVITLGVDIDGLDRLLNAIKELHLQPLPQDIEAFVRETKDLPTRDELTGHIYYSERRMFSTETERKGLRCFTVKS